MQEISLGQVEEASSAFVEARLGSMSWWSVSCMCFLKLNALFLSAIVVSRLGHQVE